MRERLFGEIWLGFRPSRRTASGRPTICRHGFLTIELMMSLFIIASAIWGYAILVRLAAPLPGYVQQMGASLDTSLNTTSGNVPAIGSAEREFARISWDCSYDSGSQGCRP